MIIVTAACWVFKVPFTTITEGIDTFSIDTFQFWISVNNLIELIIPILVLRFECCWIDKHPIVAPWTNNRDWSPLVVKGHQSVFESILFNESASIKMIGIVNVKTNIGFGLRFLV